MLKRLHLKNFTVFADADFEFGPGLNVLVGTNGTGKSHVLKVGYAILRSAARLSKGEINDFELIWDKNNFQNSLFETLKGSFQPDRSDLGQLVRWNSKQHKTLVISEFGDNSLSKAEFKVQKAEPSGKSMSLIELGERPSVGDIIKPVFIPAKEVLTLAWISRIGEYRKIPIDETYTDLLYLLRPLPLVKPAKAATEALVKLEKILGGSVEQAGERFYLIPKEGAQVKIEMDLVAEGLRKFGTLSQLLANGSLTENATLFWDEPEANLNPALLRKLAAILAELAHHGFQIILATHSTDLLKEFHILSRQKDAKEFKIKYFGLNAEPGEATRIVSTDNFEHLPDVVALEVELKQADELENIFIREDREYYANNPGEEPGL